MSAPDEKDGLKTWLLANDVKNMELDEIFTFDEAKHQELLETRPWLKEFVFLSFSLSVIHHQRLRC